MLKSVESFGMSTLDEAQSKAVLFALQKLSSWDFKHAFDSVEASIFEAWEFMIATHLHEAKIEDVRLRKSISSQRYALMFVSRQVAEWANTVDTKQEYCYVKALGGSNSCQQMLAYSLALAVQDIENRVGTFRHKTWQLGNLKKVRYEHPFGKTFLKDYFEYERTHKSGRNTPAMLASIRYDENDAFLVTSGSVFRSLFDLSEPTSAYFASDVEIDLTKLYGKSELEKGLVDIWENSRYFRLPTKEMAEQIRFKLNETQESTFLHPQLVQDRPEKPKGGCPFGYE